MEKTTPDASESAPTIPTTVPIKYPRCHSCKKKVSVLLACPYCQGNFCVRDRTPESHLCSQLSRLKEERIFLPKIVPSKIDIL